MPKDKGVKEGAGRQREYRKLAVKEKHEESKKMLEKAFIDWRRKDPYIKKTPITEDTE